MMAAVLYHKSVTVGMRTGRHHIFLCLHSKQHLRVIVQRGLRMPTSVTSQNGDVSGGPGTRPGMVSGIGGPDRCFCRSFLASRRLFSSSLCWMYAVASANVKGRPPLFSGRLSKLSFALSKMPWCAPRTLSRVSIWLSGLTGPSKRCLGHLFAKWCSKECDSCTVLFRTCGPYTYTMPILM